MISEKLIKGFQGFFLYIWKKAQYTNKDWLKKEKKEKFWVFSGIFVDQTMNQWIWKIINNVGHH